LRSLATVGNRLLPAAVAVLYAAVA